MRTEGRTKALCHAYLVKLIIFGVVFMCSRAFYKVRIISALVFWRCRQTLASSHHGLPPERLAWRTHPVTYGAYFCGPHTGLRRLSLGQSFGFAQLGKGHFSVPGMMMSPGRMWRPPREPGLCEEWGEQKDVLLVKYQVVVAPWMTSALVNDSDIRPGVATLTFAN